MMHKDTSVIQLVGEYPLETDAETTWAQLIKPEVLGACIKGCDEVVLCDKGQYSARFTFGFGPLKKTITADLRIDELDPPTHYVLVAMLETRKLGNAGGQANVTLTPAKTGCVLQYSADVEVSGWFNTFSDSVIRAAAGRTLGVFFERFATLTKEKDQ